jgi:hypothetical protein
MSQTINVPAAGQYTVSFQAAGRGNYGNGALPFDVTMDGAVLGTFTPSSLTAFNTYSTSAFTISSAGSHILAFVGHNVSTDHTSFIDLVAMQSVGSGSAPAITSASTATGTAGSAFSYQIAATNSPTSYNATGLPSGVSVNTITGVITGAPDTFGVYTVLLSAINASGTGTATLTLSVNAVGAAPVITSTSFAAGPVNSAFSYQITATNSPTGYNATGLPSNLSVNTTTGVISGTPTVGGTSSVTLSAINSSGTGTATLTLLITGTSGRGGTLIQDNFTEHGGAFYTANNGLYGSVLNGLAPDTTNVPGGTWQASDTSNESCVAQPSNPSNYAYGVWESSSYGSANFNNLSVLRIGVAGDSDAISISGASAQLTISAELIAINGAPALGFFSGTGKTHFDGLEIDSAGDLSLVENGSIVATVPWSGGTFNDVNWSTLRSRIA